MKPLLRLIVTVLATVLFAACHTSRFVPEGSYLLTSAHVAPATGESHVPAEELAAYMPQRPNSKWFSLFNVPLGIYSLSGRDSTKRFNRFLRHLGEAPVVYDRERTLQACRNMQLSVKAMGYLGADVLLEEKVKKNRIGVTYRIVPGPRWHIRHFSFRVLDDSLRLRLDSLGYQPSFTSAAGTAALPYSIKALDAERSRLYVQ